MLCIMLWLLSSLMLENGISRMIFVKDPTCLLCTRGSMLMTMCVNGLTCLHCKRIESDPYMIHLDLRAGKGLVVKSLMCNLKICFRSWGSIILNVRAWLTNQYEMNLMGCILGGSCHIGHGRELSATCEDHLWAHGRSKYFVREPPLEPSSR